MFENLPSPVKVEAPVVKKAGRQPNQLTDALKELCGTEGEWFQQAGIESAKELNSLIRTLRGYAKGLGHRVLVGQIVQEDGSEVLLKEIGLLEGPFTATFGIKATKDGE
jgi:hypothetical protein